MWNVFPSRNDGNAVHRIGGGRLNADRRVYVSINPDARGINPRTEEGNEGRGESIDRADWNGCLSDLNAGLPLSAVGHVCVM